MGAETQGRVLRSVFFGGGTPSLMLPETVAGILDVVRATWVLANDCEVTLEANPGSVEAGRFAGYAEAGVNRISMGFQSLEDRSLRLLGRMHTAEEALRALDIARNVFERVSFDLIYARQDQTVAQWETELGRALSFGTEHLSLYQLTIEEGTPFAKRFALGQLRGLPQEDAAADMYAVTQAMCEAAGLPAYEVSNHARPGAESRHNMIYWTAGDYVGVGPGAHGRLTLGSERFATESPRQPAAWLTAVERGSGEAPRERLGREDQATEYLIMGLRTSAGLSMSRLARLSGQEIAPGALDNLQDMGLVSLQDDVLCTTPHGRLLLNGIIREIAPLLDRA